MVQGADGAGAEGELTLKVFLLLTACANKALCLLEIKQKITWEHILLILLKLQ